MATPDNHPVCGFCNGLLDVSGGYGLSLRLGDLVRLLPCLRLVGGRELGQMASLVFGFWFGAIWHQSFLKALRLGVVKQMLDHLIQHDGLEQC